MPQPREPKPPKPRTGRPAAKTDRGRLDELKRAIEAGEYETPEKLQVTLRRLLADLRAAAKARRPTRKGDPNP